MINSIFCISYYSEWKCAMKQLGTRELAYVTCVCSRTTLGVRAHSVIEPTTTCSPGIVNAPYISCVFSYPQYSYVSHAISASVSSVRCCCRANDVEDSGEASSWHAQFENETGV